MSFGDYEKAISILENIKNDYRARAEHASFGGRIAESEKCFHSITAISHCQVALQEAWDDEEKAFATHYEINNKDDQQRVN